MTANQLPVGVPFVEPRAAGCRKLLIALPAAVSLLLATSLTADASTRPLLTPSQVAGVVSTYSAANNRANATLSYSGQAKDEEGSALALDNESFVLDRRAGLKTLDGAKYTPFTEVPFSTDVVKSTTYPATFATLITSIARGDTPAMKVKDAQAPTLEVFSRSNESSPWRVSFEPFVSTSIGKFATGKKGYAMSPPTTGLAFAPAQIPGRVAAALQAYARNGTLAPGLTASDFTTTGHSWAIENFYQGVQSIRKEGLQIDSFTVTAYSHSDLHTYAMESGDTLVTFSLLASRKISPPKGRTLSFINTPGQPNTWDVVGSGYVTATQLEVCELVALDTPAHGTSAASGSIPTLVGAYCGYIAGARAIR